MKQFFMCVMLLIAACHDERPPAPTAQQSDQLNEADGMLNAEAANAIESNSPGQSNTAQ